MAANKEELAQEIDTLLGQSGSATTLAEAAQLRTRLARALAEKIDAYVQFQIGARLETILRSVGTPASDGNVVPLVPGPGYQSLIRRQ